MIENSKLSIIQMVFLPLYNLHIIFENTQFFMDYFTKIGMRIYSKDLPGRNSRINWLFSKDHDWTGKF